MPSTPRITALAIEDELLLPVLQRGLDNPGISLGPVVAATGDQPNTIGIALEAEAVAVILDLVEPLWCGRDMLADRGNAKIETQHRLKIGTSAVYCESIPHDSADRSGREAARADRTTEVA